MLTVPLSGSIEHPTYPDFAQPIYQFYLNKYSITFHDDQSADSITITITDDAIYRYVQTSFDGQNWIQRTIQNSTQCSFHPDDPSHTWLTGTCNLSIHMAASDFPSLLPGTTAVRNYITAYSCDEVLFPFLPFRLGWDCHDGWQILQFNATLAEAPDPCEGVDCDDLYPCTADSCSGGVCSNVLTCISDGQCCSGCPSDPDCGPAPTCSDGERNGDETGIDCGGSCPPCSSSRTFYVSNSGDDSSSGLSELTPWRTISKVNSMTFSPGDSILFRRGDTWSQTLVPPSSGSTGNPILFGAYGSGSKPKFSFSTNTEECIRILDRDYITIDNLEVTGPCSFGILIRSSDYVTVSNSYIHHIMGYKQMHCIFVGDFSYPYDPTAYIVNAAKYARILNNEISYCGLEGIYGSSENIEIAYNNIHHADVWSESEDSGGDLIQLNLYSPGFHVHHNTLDHSNTPNRKGCFISSHAIDYPEHGVDPSTNGIFENNLCIGGPNDEFSYSSTGEDDIIRYNIFTTEDDYFQSNGIKIVNNAQVYYNVVNGYARGIYAPGSNYAEIYNNVIVDATTGLHANEPGTRTFYYKNNLLLDVYSVYSVSSGTTVDASNNIRENDPAAINQLVMDYANDDFHLRSGSAAINAGVDVGLTRDFDGNSIIGNPDIGAFEYQ